MYQDFHKVVKTTDYAVKWPKGRSGHASAVINTISSNGIVNSHLIISGGVDDNGDTISDCWIIDLQSLISCQVMYIT